VLAAPSVASLEDGFQAGSLAGSQAESRADGLRDWAVLVYSSASPDIEAPARQALAEIDAAALAPGTAVAVQLGTQQQVQRYVVDAQGRHAVATQPVDMAKRESLEDFLRWGLRTIPARHVMVVVGGHGGGYLGVVEDAERRHLMPLTDTAQALRDAGVHADVLAFNACLMAGAEVADEVAPSAQYVVASQGVEEHEGMALGRVIAGLGPQTSGEQAASMLASTASACPERTPTLSAWSSQRLAPVVEALNSLGQAVLAAPACRAELRADIARLRSFYDQRPWDRPLSDYRDALAFASSLAADEALPSAVRAAARHLGESVAQAVVVSSASQRADAHGLSLYLPLESLTSGLGPAGKAADALYHRLALAGGSPWSRAVDLIAEGST
jgi:Clostripain family